MTPGDRLARNGNKQYLAVLCVAMRNERGWHTQATRDDQLLAPTGRSSRSLIVDLFVSPTLTCVTTGGRSSRMPRRGVWWASSSTYGRENIATASMCKCASVCLGLAKTRPYCCPEGRRYPSMLPNEWWSVYSAFEHFKSEKSTAVVFFFFWRQSVQKTFQK